MSQLETGWLRETPIGDTVLRRFLYNQSDLNEVVALASGGRAERSPTVALADAGGPIAYFNQAILLRPLTGRDDPTLEEIESFFRPGGGRPHTLLSLWPTPDLAARGWSLIGHPAFMARGPSPHEAAIPPDVEIRAVTDVEDLYTTERIAVEGFPIDEAKGLPQGTMMGPGLLDTHVRYRLGLLSGDPVAAAGSHVGQGVVNLCFAATLPAARRRGVWEALVWARVGDAPDLPAVAYTSDYSRPGFERMGFLPIIRFTLWLRT